MLAPHVRWPLFVVGALVLQVVASLITIYLATSNPSYAVEDDYYHKALRWDEIRAQQRRNDELGWRMTFDVTPPAPTGESARLSVDLTDADGAPIDGATVTVEAFHNARADEILRAPFEARGDGHYRASLPMRRSGLWEFRFVSQRGDDRFTFVETRHLVLDRKSRQG